MDPRAKHVAFVANGQIEDTQLLARRLRTFEMVIAVDGGLSACAAAQVTPSIIIGDFDSVTQNQLASYPDTPAIAAPDPDKTDLEKALSYLPFEKGVVFGALGGRIDHTLTNICLLSRYPKRLSFETESQWLFVTGDTAEIEIKKGQTISLIPLNGNVLGVTSKGLKWELSGKDLGKEFIGISNVALEDKVFLSHMGGDLLVCVCNEGVS